MRKMKTTKKIKAFALTLAMALGMLLPTTMNAQSDGFFRGGNDGNQYRGTEGIGNETFGSNDTFGPYSNNTVEAPLGSGIMILIAAGAGYVALKKKED